MIDLVKPIIVILGATFPDTAATRVALSAVDVEIIETHDHPIAISPQELESVYGVITDHIPVDEAMIEALTNCKVICRYGIGLDNVDIRAASRAGVIVTHVPDYCLIELADHALALLLAVARRIVAYDRAVRSGEWDYIRPGVRRLNTQTLGLIGFGRIARGLRERVRPLGMRVVAFDPYVEPAVLEAHGVESLTLDRLLAEADAVSLHAPLTENTGGMIGRDELRRMRDTAILVNTARGRLVDQDALAEALAERWIAGAGLDVLVREPPLQDDPLLSLESVVITPHAGHYSEESLLQVQQEAGEEVVRALTNREPKYIVNADALRER